MIGKLDIASYGLKHVARSWNIQIWEIWQTMASTKVKLIHVSTKVLKIGLNCTNVLNVVICSEKKKMSMKCLNNVEKNLN